MKVDTNQDLVIQFKQGKHKTRKNNWYELTHF